MASVGMIGASGIDTNALIQGLVGAESTPITLLITFLVAINRFPLPIDSEASSGEAL